MRGSKRYRRLVKPLLDRGGAALLLVLLSPLLLLTACAVYLALGRPVLYRQLRPGFRERPFTPLKFRTMLDATDAAGQPLPDEKRLTSFGRFLRRTSLDELPQLVNILRGELSFVGPRPLLSEYLPLYSAEQRRRHEVRPGLTGLAQVAGRNALDWTERLRLDVEYVDTMGAALDMRILAKTLVMLLRGTGVSAEGHATVPRFRGNPG
jgi:lipopolysaccharide/colanic/teichoic acid biosynthesis glycosyltransferase